MISDADIAAIYDGLNTMVVDLDDIPTPVGIRQQTALVRSYLTKATRHQIDLRRSKNTLMDQLRRLQAEQNVKMTEMLATDATTRRQSSLTDRRSYALYILKDLGAKIDDLTLSVAALDGVEEVVRLKIRNLQGTVADLRLQYGLLKIDRDLAGPGSVPDSDDDDMPSADSDDEAPETAAITSPGVSGLSQEDVDELVEYVPPGVVPTSDPVDLAATFDDPMSLAEEPQVEFSQALAVEDFSDLLGMAEPTVAEPVLPQLSGSVTAQPEVVSSEDVPSPPAVVTSAAAAVLSDEPESAVSLSWDDLLGTGDVPKVAPSVVVMTGPAAPKPVSDVTSVLDAIQIGNEVMVVQPKKAEAPIDFDDLLSSLS